MIESLCAMDMRARSVACLLGGAVGDALGAPVEFMSDAEIRRAFGDKGLTAMAPAYGRTGAITDDTQMMLFTAEGLLRAYVRGCLYGIPAYVSCVHHAYLRWLMTQGYSVASHRAEADGWLFECRELHSRRAPGNTCLSALADRSSERGSKAHNDSKGCGGVMRVAPVGVFFAVQYVHLDQAEGAEQCFRVAVDVAALTHGHPTGTLSAGACAETIYWMMTGIDCKEAVKRSLQRLQAQPRSEETAEAVRLAMRLSETGLSPSAAIRQLGQGWVAEEALAIGIYCALSSRNYRDGVTRAVNHDGDSDSTGLIAGHLLGLSGGLESIPGEWLAPLELREVICEVAKDLAVHGDWYLSAWGYSNPGEEEAADAIWTRYPGH